MTQKFLAFSLAKQNLIKMASSWLAYKQSSNTERFKTWLAWSQLSERDYQLQANAWCEKRELADKYRGGILADEMGLGKTIVMMGRIFTHSVKRTLIVVPLALLQQWDKCINDMIFSSPLRWLSRSQYVIYHGSQDPINFEALQTKRLVITTYGTLSARCGVLQEFLWNRVIYDEAHHLRDMYTKVHKSAAILRSEINWFVTGTPIQNKVQDFYALCALLGYSTAYYADEEGTKEIIKTHVLRRTKKQVGLGLLPVKKHCAKIYFKSALEKALAYQIHSYISPSIPEEGGGSDVVECLNMQSPAMFVRARQMCIYPPLLISVAKTQSKSEPLHKKWLNVTSSKMDVVAATLIRRASNGRRKLVFSHYRAEIDELDKRLVRAGITVGKIDGRTSAAERKAFLDPNTNTRTSPPQILIMQIQTCCEGLNLQAFTEVYFTSPHWNPAVEDQAIARAHRIGQKYQVDVFRFKMVFDDIDLPTLDEYSSQVQRHKRKITKKFFN